MHGPGVHPPFPSLLRDPGRSRLTMLPTPGNPLAPDWRSIARPVSVMQQRDMANHSPAELPAGVVGPGVFWPSWEGGSRLHHRWRGVLELVPNSRWSTLLLRRGDPVSGSFRLTLGCCRLPHRMVQAVGPLPHSVGMVVSHGCDCHGGLMAATDLLWAFVMNCKTPGRSQGSQTSSASSGYSAMHDAGSNTACNFLS